jgi:hypothetical protein
MMTRQSASRWPIRTVRTLANLQVENLREPTSLRPWLSAKSSRGGQPVRPIPGLEPAKPPRPLRTALPNHRQHILRDRIERRHRLRVSLERPLRHNQIRKLC